MTTRHESTDVVFGVMWFVGLCSCVLLVLLLGKRIKTKVVAEWEFVSFVALCGFAVFPVMNLMVSLIVVLLLWAEGNEAQRKNEAFERREAEYQRSAEFIEALYRDKSYWDLTPIRDVCAVPLPPPAFQKTGPIARAVAQRRPLPSSRLPGARRYNDIRNQVDLLLPDDPKES